MKPLHMLVLAALVSIATSVLTVAILSVGSGGPEANVAGESARGATDPALEGIRREQAALRASLAKLESSSGLSVPEPSDRARSASATSGLSVDDVRDIVDRALETRALQDKLRASDPDSVDAAMQRLLDPNLSEDERVELWASLAEAGTLDAVLAEFERRAENAPLDSMTQADLGFAYLQKMRYSGGGPEAGKWGRKGSDAYARALELDETNWDARFAQARHLYYADMTADALRHFNILRSQQKNRRPEARHAEAFVFLGNVYLELGNVAEAKNVWIEGLALFPNHERMSALLKAIE